MMTFISFFPHEMYIYILNIYFTFLNILATFLPSLVHFNCSCSATKYFKNRIFRIISAYYIPYYSFATIKTACIIIRLEKEMCLEVFD